MRNLFTKIFFGAMLANSIPAMWGDQPVRYHDREHNDDHEWNDGEDRAYRRFLEEKHRTYREFRRLKEKERQEYWHWRHEHMDRG
jgi:hypothetical protein